MIFIETVIGACSRIVLCRKDAGRSEIGRLLAVMMDAAGVNDPGPYATLRLIVVVVVIVERSHNRPGLKPDFHAEDAARKSHGSVLPHNPRLSHPRFTTVSPLCGPGMT